MKRALITTTIHTGHRLHSWAQQLRGDDIIVIAGDQRSPHDELRTLVDALESEFGVHSIYLDPKTQARRYPRTSAALPWNCIQRRNLALLEALHHSPDYVITVDDDNVPAMDDWVEHVDALLTNTDEGVDVDLVDGGDWWDPGRLNFPYFPFRGLPIEKRVSSCDDTYLTARSGWRGDRVGVFQSMILGDPDVDAITRLVTQPHVSMTVGDVVCALGTWAPFNSQATVWSREVAPLMFMWPFVGRYDDIWASYLARAFMDSRKLFVRYGSPLVRQERNAHSVYDDLRAELFGMEHNLTVVNALRAEGTHITSETPTLEALIALFARVTKLDFMPPQLGHTFGAWLEDIAELEWIK